MRDGVIVWHDSDAGSYTAEAWRVLLRDLGDVKMRIYAAEDAHREAIASIARLESALASAVAWAETVERERDARAADGLAVATLLDMTRAPNCDALVPAVGELLRKLAA
jgi:hypothetical protein